MRPPDYTYQLDKDQIQLAQDIIRQEKKDLMPPWQKRSYQVFNFSVIAFLILFPVVSVMAFLINDNDTQYLILGFLSIFLGFVIIALIVSFILNIPLFNKLRKRIRLMQKMGKYNVMKIRHAESKGSNRFIIVVTRFILIAGVIIVILTVLVLIFYLIGSSIQSVATDIIDLLLAIGGFFMILLAGVSLMMNYYLRLNKRRLQKAEELSSSFQQYEEQAVTYNDLVDIPMSKYDDIVKLEQQQISFNRMETLLSMKEDEFESYSIQKSKKTHELLAAMDSKLKLAVTDKFNELAMDPDMEGVSTDPATNVSKIDMEGSGYAVEFSVDKPGKKINIIDISKL